MDRGEVRHVSAPPDFDLFPVAAINDPLWNAAQRELMATGGIHNYLRMLWGKKVIEWSKTPEEAYRTLVHLNNKYALDLPLLFILRDRGAARSVARTLESSLASKLAVPRISSSLCMIS